MIAALQGGPRTYLVHNFSNGLDGEDRFVVERFKALINGDIRPIDTEAPKTKGRRKTRRTVVSRKAVEAMLPARTEIMLCTGLLNGAADRFWGTSRRGFSTTAARGAARRSHGRPAGGKPAGAPVVRNLITPGGHNDSCRSRRGSSSGPRALPQAGCRTAGQPRRDPDREVEDHHRDRACRVSDEPLTPNPGSENESRPGARSMMYAVSQRGVLPAAAIAGTLQRPTETWTITIALVNRRYSRRFLVKT